MTTVKTFRLPGISQHRSPGFLVGDAVLGIHAKPKSPAQQDAQRASNAARAAAIGAPRIVARRTSTGAGVPVDNGKD